MYKGAIGVKVSPGMKFTHYMNRINASNAL